MEETKSEPIPVPQGPKAGDFAKGLWKELTASITPAKLGQWLTSLGGRRFVLALGAGVVTSVLVWYGKITPEIYRDVVLGTVGMYIAGNTFQKVKAQQSG